jgi:hypothetical protein
MAGGTSREIETLTVRIPMRLQRRGGRRLIVTLEHFHVRWNRSRSG